MFSHVQVIADGFVRTKASYLKNGWNVLDFVLVVTSMIDICFSLYYKDNESSGGKGKHTDIIKGFRVLRATRALRPLRWVHTIDFANRFDRHYERLSPSFLSRHGWSKNVSSGYSCCVIVHSNYTFHQNSSFIGNEDVGTLVTLPWLLSLLMDLSISISSRMIRKAPGLKLVVQTLLYSLKPIGNTVLIAAFFYIIFGILGVQVNIFFLATT